MLTRSATVCVALALMVACGGGGSSSPASPTPTTATPPPTTTTAPTTPTTPTTPAPSAPVTWQFINQTWQPSGTPPACPSPVLRTPLDMSLVTSMLYPGQVRGGNYKAHGGFRLDSPGQTVAVNVVAAMDGIVLRGARYIEQGDVQYLFDFINSCGFLYRYDHLRALSPRFQALADTLPAALPNMSMTTNFSGQTVAAGEAVGTAIGFVNNVSLDFGVYDLRQRNSASSDAAWLASHPGETSPYGVCWFDLLPGADAARARALPSGDGLMGRTSDYCR